MVDSTEKAGSDEVPSLTRSRIRSQSFTPRFIDSYEWIEFQPQKSPYMHQKINKSDEDFVDMSDLGVLCVSIDPNDEFDESLHSFRQETPHKDDKHALLHKLFPKIPDPSVAEDPHHLKRTMSISTRISHTSPSPSSGAVATVENKQEGKAKSPDNEQLEFPDAVMIEYVPSYDLENSSCSEVENENQTANFHDENDSEEVVELPMAILMPHYRHQPVHRSRSFERRKAQGNWPPLSVTDRVPEVMLQPSEMLMQHQHHLPLAAEAEAASEER